MVKSVLHELNELERILEQGKHLFRSSIECIVPCHQHRFPIYVATLGSQDPAAPAVGFFGGIHGLEGIGTRILLAFMHNLTIRLRWDTSLAAQLEHVRLVFMPLINPGGMHARTRANPNGVDLMRNAPVEASETVPLLVGGQRISHHLPWFRGLAGADMEIESQALARVVRRELLVRPFSLALDCHSGFGLRDRIWFPWAHSRRPHPRIAELHALKSLFEDSYPHHPYIFEPQCQQYLTHGDLWDYLSLEAQAQPHTTLLPLTLELGSWLWVKKNPKQLLTLSGMFNPLVPHREQRVLRGHLLWFDFLVRATSAWTLWQPDATLRRALEQAATQQWFPHLATLAEQDISR
ncbi:DUF2817 domain-containing protein [Burkholderiaceae bacterium DAT-1]|nr:DUF2817 domain-containing protein [Burkholderiaceae bacterium DAT-1]